MYPRIEYEMSQDDLTALLDACKPVPAMLIGGTAPASPQENANQAWAALGKKMRFDSMTVQPVPNKGQRFFTAVPLESDEARSEREAREAGERRNREAQRLRQEIDERQARLDALLAEAGKSVDPRRLACSPTGPREIGISCHTVEISAAAYGVRSGWFIWPFNFDPVWLTKCSLYEAKA